jgi:hypothetical protein
MDVTFEIFPFTLKLLYGVMDWYNLLSLLDDNNTYWALLDIAI